jgi:DNA-binding transcriptional LysR family regulator
LASASDLQRDVAELGSSIVTLGAAASTTRSFLARFLSEWMPQHKDVQVAPVEDTDCGLLSKVQSGECDVAIVAGPIPDTVEALHIRSVELVALFNHASSFADATEKVPVGVFDVANEPLLLNFPGCPSRDLLAREFSSFGATPNVVYECSAGTTLAALCEGGLGVAIFGAVMDLSEFDVCVRPLVGNRGQRLRYDLCVVWARNTSRTWIRELGIEMATSCRRPTVMDASTAWCAPLHTGSSRVDKGS